MIWWVIDAPIWIKRELSASLKHGDEGLWIWNPLDIQFMRGITREDLFSMKNLKEDLLICVENEKVVTPRKFREIGEYFGLVFQGFPGTTTF